MGFTEGAVGEIDTEGNNVGTGGDTEGDVVGDKDAKVLGSTVGKDDGDGALEGSTAGSNDDTIVGFREGSSVGIIVVFTNRMEGTATLMMAVGSAVVST